MEIPLTCKQGHGNSRAYALSTPGGKPRGFLLPPEYCEVVIVAYRSFEPYAWHSIFSAVYHVATDCTVGNNIEFENIRRGSGGRRLCRECRRIVFDGLLQYR